MPRAARLLATPLLLAVLVLVATPTMGSFRPTAPPSGPVSDALRPAAPPPTPYPNDMAASIVVGQPNFTANGSSSGASTAPTSFGNQLYAAIFDVRGDLWVADFQNNRVLEFAAPMGSGAAATLVLGQSSFRGSLPGIGPGNFSGPDGLAFDAAGNLWVADYYNNRVMEFVPPFLNGSPARLVIGQSSFAGSGAGNLATNFSGPSGLAIHDGALWVCDFGNNRALEFAPPFANGSAAVLALGQSSLTGYFNGTTATNLSAPEQIAFDAAGNAWVADYLNDRVVEFAAPFSLGETETAVLGESNFTSNFSYDPSSLVGPDSVWFDGRGNLWVADSGDNRTVVYPGPVISSLEEPSGFLGQPDNSTYNGAAGATGLNTPTAVVTDPAGNIWVVDAGNNRILGYRPLHFALTFAASGLPAGDNWTVVFNGSTYTQPIGTTVPLSVENGSYPWSSPGAPHGFQLPFSSGNATVNGSATTVVLAFRPFSYPVTFYPVGLANSARWSVSLGAAVGNATGYGILFNATNGSYTYAVARVAGYSITPISGSVTVNGAPQNITIHFRATPSSGFLGLSDLDWILIVGAIVVVVVLAVVLAARRSRPVA